MNSDDRKRLACATVRAYKFIERFRTAASQTQQIAVDLLEITFALNAVMTAAVCHDRRGQNPGRTLTAQDDRTNDLSVVASYGFVTRFGINHDRAVWDFYKKLRQGTILKHVADDDRCCLRRVGGNVVLEKNAVLLHRCLLNDERPLRAAASLIWWGVSESDIGKFGS